MTDASPRADLHEGFRDPLRADPAALTDFLDEVDRLPGVRAVHRAIRRSLGIRPGMRVLDAGCGIGLEVTRLARQHPDADFTGLDQNPELLRTARRRAVPPPPNLTWVHAALETSGLAEGSYDAVRTERVLMYAPGPLFGELLDLLVRLLRPGGRLVLFELDYGATMLSPGPDGDTLVRPLEDLLHQALPQPLAGRKIPLELTARGMAEVAAVPFSFSVNEPVWRRIVHDTLRLALEREPGERGPGERGPGERGPGEGKSGGRDELRSWLEAQAAAAHDSPFLAAFTGVLTTARR
ncbi:methyltransferase domain-containing protein [Streptomyces sp. NPDC021098]|uniref:methyltransferase domain-containing protein n=1 Tax=unclassified Streptomyces TaxID=2593676 RepID=UPI0037879D25